MHRLVGKTAGSFAAALVPAAFLFLRPTLVVGRGGGSYLGFSFCIAGQSVWAFWFYDDRFSDMPSYPSRPFHRLHHPFLTGFDPTELLDCGCHVSESDAHHLVPRGAPRAQWECADGFSVLMRRKTGDPLIRGGVGVSSMSL